MALNSKQLKAIPILIGEDTVEEAARKAGIAKNTFYKWMKQEEFLREIASARKKLFDRAMNKLMSVTMRAVITLEKLLNAESESVRRATANDVLGHVLKYRELQEISERLEVLEKIVTEKGEHRS